jgi:phosphoserine phosphatase
MKGVAHKIEPLTKKAMNGELSFEEIFEQRLTIIQPRQQDLIALGYRYCETITPGARELIAELQRQKKKIYVVSGGYNPAVRMLTQMLGIPDSYVYANELEFNTDGSYKGIVKNPERIPYPLWTDAGKKKAVSDIMRRTYGKYAFIGESTGDAQTGAHRFICFAGVVQRPSAMTKTPYTFIRALLAQMYL